MFPVPGAEAGEAAVGLPAGPGREGGRVPGLAAPAFHCWGNS